MGDVRDFYELLVLLRILGPCIGPRTHGTLRTSSFDELLYTPVRRFLDRLSWMCDYEPGGDTVSSIAVEETADGSVFWLATTYKCVPAIRPHLTEIIELLRSAHRLSAKDSHDLERKICNKCIAFASKRVKHYSKLLAHLIEQCRKVLSSSDEQLAQDLSHLARLESSPLELCTKADHFRDSESLKLLSRRVASTTSPSMWSMLRHYIGRLGSWHHASRTLVSYAGKRPQLFAEFQVTALPTPKPIVVPRADESTNLHSVLSRVFTEHEQLELKRGIENLQRLYSFDLDSAFRKAYADKNFKPRVHAEVWLFEHFYWSDLHFLDDDRYVGCSKPSCYCCNLYFLEHEEGSIRRPCHGNVWTNWQSPLHQDGSKHAVDANLRSAMISKFKEDLKNQIIKPTTNHGRIPDTTTGLTLSDVQDII